MDELWTCPRRRRRFSARSTWHSCVGMTVGEHLARLNRLDLAILDD